MSLLLHILFGCKHELSWPRKKSGFGYYQVCTVCAREFEYTGPLK